MLVTAQERTQKLTLNAYLEYCEETDTRYELVEGELVPMGIGSGKHGAIIKLLEFQLDNQIRDLNHDWIALSQGAIGIQSPRGGRWDTVRIPDVTVLPLSQWRDLQHREAIIALNEPPPLLVIEVVSESTQRTDYRAKRAEYSVLNISEYWIVDPLAASVTVLTLVDGWYEAERFSGREPVRSQTFPNFTLTAEQILNPLLH